MKLNDTDDRTLEGNLQGRTYQVGISDMRLIIDRLTDMYSDRELASIREYSCNAWDAHVEAGVTSPIEVQTPGPLAPFLTIRDYGIGLTEKDIEEIYSQYGASTKRMSNDQTGAFGLGCKSALAYSDQFTVTSIKDGIRIQVVVSRDPKEGVTMKVVDTSTTSEPNGTTVMIPARSGNTFASKAREFFKHWKPGTVLLDGAQPEFMPGVKWVTDSICINEDQGYGSRTSTVVMGGVPYPAQIAHGLGYSSSVTAFVPIGTVTPKPDREALIDDDDTTETLQQISADFVAGLQSAILKDIASADSAPEAARKRREWNGKVGGNMPPMGSMVWKGRLVPESYQCVEDTILAPHYGRKMNQHLTYRKDHFIPLPQFEGALWVTGFDYASFTATVKKKMVKYCDDNNIVQPTYFVLSMNKPTSPWLSNVTYVDWPTVKAIKLPRNVVSPTTGRIPGSYDLFESGDWNEGIPGDDIDTQNDLFWMEGTKYYDGQHVSEYLNKSYPGCTLVMLRVGREGKFQRNFPSARRAYAVIAADFKKWVAALDKDTVTALSIQENADRRLHDIDPTKVDDPEIKRVRSIMDKDTSTLEQEQRTWRSLGQYWTPDDVKHPGNPLTKYALIPDRYDWTSSFRHHPDAIYRYLNCEYKFLSQKDAS